MAKDLNKTEEEVKALWDTPMSDPMRLAHHKFITASLYADQVSSYTYYTMWVPLLV